MAFLVLAYVAGVLTILSPCILPVLPFVLARADRTFLRHGLPMLLGMALAFTAVASLAAVGGNWAVQANDYGRLAALALLAVFALSLLWPGLAGRLARPLVAWGARLSEQRAGDHAEQGGFASSLWLGVAAGLLWAPCAGPVLGLILTGAALRGPNVGTSLLLLAYAAGAVSSLALAWMAGGRVFAVLKSSLGVGQGLRRIMGAAVLAGVGLIATGLDRGLLSQLSLGSTTRIEQALITTFNPASARPETRWPGDADLMPVQFKPAGPPPAACKGELCALDKALGWINSPPLNAEALRGKVVLVDFWTYSCINCLRTLPYVRAWADKYKDAGLVVVGVHSPEFAFEKNPDKVRRAVKDLGIGYPVAVDSDHAIWRAFRNQYWPALYFVDAQGKVRHQIFGEGRYDEAERAIQTLLAEKSQQPPASGLVAVQGQGTQAPPGSRALSGETYLGHDRAAGFVPGGGLVRDRLHRYDAAATLRLNQWTLGGDWTVEAERAVAGRAGARLSYRFNARDLHLVLGRGPGDAPVRFRVLVDGQPPAGNHGTDIDAEGRGQVDAHALYQLVRLPSSAGEHVFEIEFLDPGAQVYAFTFG